MVMVQSSLEENCDFIIQAAYPPTSEDQSGLVKALIKVNTQFNSTPLVKRIMAILKAHKPAITTIAKALNDFTTEYLRVKDACNKAQAIGYCMPDRQHDHKK
jgi:hypothetical protein